MITYYIPTTKKNKRQKNVSKIYRGVQQNFYKKKFVIYNTYTRNLCVLLEGGGSIYLEYGVGAEFKIKRRGLKKTPPTREGAT